MTILLILLALLTGARQAPAPVIAADTLHLEVGSPEVDGRIFPPHRARNRVYPPGATEPTVSWTNELTVGDSAGRQVMRWVTIGGPVSGSGNAWELRQTYDARTLAPLAWERSAANGAYMRLRMDGLRVHGVKRAPGAGAQLEDVDMTLDRLGFIASASDLVPMAVGLRDGVVMTAPVWGPNMAASVVHVFAVLGQEAVMVEGTEVVAWKVEERVQQTGALVANWYLTEESPYMVYAEVMLPDGQVQRLTGVALD